MKKHAFGKLYPIPRYRDIETFLAPLYAQIGNLHNTPHVGGIHVDLWQIFTQNPRKNQGQLLKIQRLNDLQIKPKSRIDSYIVFNCFNCLLISVSQSFSNDDGEKQIHFTVKSARFQC